MEPADPGSGSDSRRAGGKVWFGRDRLVGAMSRCHVIQQLLRMNDAIVRFLHLFQMHVQLMEKLVRGRKPPKFRCRHLSREHLEFVAAQRKGVCLTVLEKLQTVLEMPQEFVSRCKPRILRFGEEVFVP